MYKKGEAHSSTSEPVGQAWYSAQYDKMSYYYNYTIGYMTADKKVYPFGPYNSNSKLKDVVSKSASFASDLHEAFWPVNDDMMTDELKKDFEYESRYDEMEMPDIRYL